MAMRKFTAMLFLTTLAAALPAAAQWRRDDPYRDDRGYRGGPNRGGYDRETRVIDRVRDDLNSVRSLRYAGHGDRKHYEHAMEALGKFENKFHQGKWDRGQLDRAIENIASLANSGRIHPNDRYLLQRDVEALREFRARGAYGGGYPGGWRSDRYWP